MLKKIKLLRNHILAIAFCIFGLIMVNYHELNMMYWMVIISAAVAVVVVLKSAQLTLRKEKLREEELAKQRGKAPKRNFKK